MNTSQQIKAVWSGAAPQPRRRKKATAADPRQEKKKKPQKPRFNPAKENAAFENCYRGQTVAEEDWPAFVGSLRAPLPTTFSFVRSGCCDVEPELVQASFERLVGALAARVEAPSRGAACVASGSRTILRLHLGRGKDAPCAVRAFLRVEGVDAPRTVAPMAWFPGRRGWQVDAPRQELKALRSTFRELRAFLDEGSMLGRLNRQEAVSMLPPLLLRVRRGDSILDMCAAPGSKTVLLLAQLALRPEAGAEGGGPSRGGEDDGGVTRRGCVVANDINPQRCNRLRVRLARSRLPGTVLVCHAGQLVPGPDGSYDRVLCDVPCSGDGTLRKNPDIWDSWQPRYSASLHPLQAAILTRGLQLLRPGGLLVYSTCSFSPLENEAVVAAVLSHCERPPPPPSSAQLHALPNSMLTAAHARTGHGRAWTRTRAGGPVRDLPGLALAPSLASDPPPPPPPSLGRQARASSSSRSTARCRSCAPRPESPRGASTHPQTAAASGGGKRRTARPSSGGGCAPPSSRPPPRPPRPSGCTAACACSPRRRTRAASSSPSSASETRARAWRRRRAPRR